MATKAPPVAQAHAVAKTSRFRKLLAVEGWLFVLPVVLGTFVFDVLPMLPAVYLSMTHFDGITTPVWIGLENFADMWRYGDFANSIKVTLIFTGLNIPLAMAVGLCLALLINSPLRGVVVFRAIYYLPVVSSIVAVAIVWGFMFNSRFGIINKTLESVGITGPEWFNEPWPAMFVLVIVSVWSAMGYNMVLFLAGLQGISTSFYEAAEIDGANWFQRLRHITMPLLTPTTFFILIMSFIGSFQVFALVWVMTGGGPGTATEMYVFFLYEEAFRRYKWGLGSALSLVGFSIISFVTIIQWQLSKRWVHYG